MKTLLPIGGLAALCILIAGVSCSSKAPPPAPKLRLYCAGGLTPAMDELAAAYTRATNEPLEIEYGGSGALLGRIKLIRQGDLFLPAESDYIDAAQREGLVKSSTHVAYVWPVILVAKGNPKGIASLADLAKPGIRLGLGNPDSAQIGRASVQVLAMNKVDASANVVVKTTTVNELGVLVKTGHVDAAIVWDATARQYAGATQAIEIPPAQNKISRFIIAVLTCSPQPEAAARFAAFLTTPEAQAVFSKHGFSVRPPPAATAPATAAATRGTAG